MDNLILPLSYSHYMYAFAVNYHEQLLTAADEKEIAFLEEQFNSITQKQLKP